MRHRTIGQPRADAPRPHPAAGRLCGRLRPRSAATAVVAQTIVAGLHVPWGVAFVPDGTALVAERTTGRILAIPRGHRERVAMRVPGGSLGLTTFNRDGRGSPRAGDDRIVRFVP